MTYTTLGKTGLRVSRTSFGALPIQRVGLEEAARILRCAFENGINFFDTARLYTDSEEKLGHTLKELAEKAGRSEKDVRGEIILATKSMAEDVEGLKSDIHTSLVNLRTDYLDLFQFHNPKNGVSDEAYAYIADLKAQGVIRHIGFTNHSLERAKALLATGLYETVQFPLSSLSTPEEIAFAQRCGEANIGFIAMKAMAGGLIHHVRENFAFLHAMEHVVPIWGIQRMSELEEFLALEAEAPALTPEMEDILAEDRAEMKGSFCRSCAYCQPCPAGIPLENVCRMDMLLGRAVYQAYIAPEWQERMARVNNCTGCGACDSRCPYGLGPQTLAKKQYAFYQAFVEKHS